MKGPKPQPTALKMLRGNPGKRALPKNEPHPEIAAPDPPEWLTGEALVEWNRIVPELLALGLLSRIDRANLVSYCQAWAELAEASIATQPIEGEVDSADALAKRSAVRRKAREQIVKFASLFGLSPADRARVHASPKEAAEQTPLAALRQPIR